MKLIFGKDGVRGVEELQLYFSHIPGTIELIDLRADIVTAQEEVITYVGESILAKAISHYYSNDFTVQDSEVAGESSGSGNTESDLNELVYRVQSAVALMAYRDFAKNNDATHTATGRISRSDKDSDVLNMRLIEADDQALQRKVLKAMDRLIKYINEKAYTEWTSSAAYKQAMDLLIWNADVLDRYFPIEKNHRVFLMLATMIRKVQIDHIIPRVGSEVFSAILGKARTGTLTLAEDTYLYDLMCYPLAEMAISEGFMKLPVQLFPENMMQQFWGPGNGASALVLREKMIKDIEDRGYESLKRLEAELEKREAAATETPITDETITDIADRMDAANVFARV
jgi:hypothetical protein